MNLLIEYTNLHPLNEMKKKDCIIKARVIHKQILGKQNIPNIWIELETWTGMS